MEEPNAELSGLLAGIQEGFNARAWYGDNLKRTLQKLEYEEACWHSAPGQSSIWELVLHASYWKFVIWRRLAGEKQAKFPREGEDWYSRPLPEMTEAQAKKAWKADLALLNAEHNRLLEAVKALSPERLEKENLAFYLRGIAMHDVYHIGQIAMIRAMYKAAQETSKSRVEE